MQRLIIQETNTLIAKFMGAKKSWYGNYLVFTVENPQLTGKINHEDIFYHSKWEWLMPVLEKIARTKIGDGETTVDYAYPYTFGKLNIETGKMMVRLNGFFVHEADTLLEATYMAVVEVLKYLEENESGSKS